MRKLALSLILLLPLTSYASKVDLVCYSSGKEIFHQKVDNAMLGDGYIVADDKDYTYFFIAECTMRFLNKDLDKK